MKDNSTIAVVLIGIILAIIIIVNIPAGNNNIVVAKNTKEKEK